MILQTLVKMLYFSFLTMKQTRSAILLPNVSIPFFSVYLMIRHPFCISKLRVKFSLSNDHILVNIFFDREITSNVYSRCKLPIVFCEHDFIIVDRYGMELGTCEVKLPGSSVVEVENYICRIGESTKRQLHRKIMQAKSEKKIVTFGIMFSGVSSIL